MKNTHWRFEISLLALFAGRLAGRYASPRSLQDAGPVPVLVAVRSRTRPRRRSAQRAATARPRPRPQLPQPSPAQALPGNDSFPGRPPERSAGRARWSRGDGVTEYCSSHLDLATSARSSDTATAGKYQRRAGHLHEALIRIPRKSTVDSELRDKH